MVDQHAAQKKGTGSVLSDRPQAMHSTGNTNLMAWRNHPVSRSCVVLRNIVEELSNQCECVSSKRKYRACQGCPSINGCDIRDARDMHDEKERRGGREGRFALFVRSVWLNVTHQTNQLNQVNQINRSRPSIF